LDQVQLYTPDLSPVQLSLEQLDLDYMKRLSGTNNEIAHIGVQIGGRIYEVMAVCGLVRAVFTRAAVVLCRWCAAAGRRDHAR
jgi:hypothetical protein